MKIYRTIILLVGLYGCETRSLTLKGERRLRVFEKRLLRRIFGPKKDKVTGEWRKLHDNVRVIKSRMRWAGHVARMEEKRGVYMVLVGKTEGKLILRWTFRKWDVGEWSGLIWLSIGTVGGHL
jgi:hypothetical protein